MIQIHVQVVNINNLGYTKEVVNDILVQSCPYKLTVIDQGSTEAGTKEYLEFLDQLEWIEVIRNKENVNLNILWNRLYHNSDCEYICFLNNDVRIPSNFLKDTVEIFEREKGVGCVVHATNHPKYCAVKELEYVVLEDKFTQGWDFTMRREVYDPIPENIDTFGGDDWLFTRMYNKDWSAAVAISSPIIHYKAKSRKYFKGDRNVAVGILAELGVDRLPYQNSYSKPHPTFEKIIE